MSGFWNLLLDKRVLFASFVLSSGAGAIIVRDFIHGGKYRGHGSAKNKVVIVTGANTGIGKFTAHGLAEKGAVVYMACRDMQKCEESRKTIVMHTNNKYVYCRPCDLASLESVRNFVKIFKEEQVQLDILVNNAGVMRCPKSVTKDGIETQLGVNHMGHFLLTNMLLDYMFKAPSARIIVLTSAGHVHGKIKKDDLNSEKSYDPEEAFNQSKLATCLFVNELSTRLLGTKVSINALYPGLVATEITRHMAINNSFSGYILHALAWFALKTPDVGAAPVLNLALNPELDGVTGQYFSSYKKSKMSQAAENVELAQWLWTVSEKWTRLGKSIV